MNQSKFDLIKEYIINLNYTICYENRNKQYLRICSEKEGIKNLSLGITDPVLIMEQFVTEIKKPTEQIMIKLLQKNRDMLHGAFVLDETGQKVIFRDTLQLENIDLNEFEGSINSLKILLNEYTKEILAISN